MNCCECHGHIFMDGADYREAVKTHKGGPDTALLARRLQALADAGVVYYRDGGDNLGASAWARDAAPDYGIEYRSCLFALHARGQYGSIVGRAFDTAGDFRALVGQAKAQKADFVKLMVSGILDFQRWGGLSGGGVELRLLPELVKIAHGEGFRVMAHVNGPERITAALEAGVDSVEHGYFMEEGQLRLLAQTSAVWVPTLAAVAAFAGRAGFTPGVAEETLRCQGQAIRRARELGALIAAGSDAGAVGVEPDRGIRREHALLAACGLSREEIAAGDRAIRERFVYGA